MSKYIAQQNKFRPIHSGGIVDELPVGVYTLGASQEMGYFLESCATFTTPSKIYGNADRDADRIVNTFMDRKISTGVLLSGERGSGKTMLLKSIAVRLLARNIPVIIVDGEYYGDDFNKFIAAINQECMLIFDEFEKTYHKDHQHTLLTLLDGMYNNKKLFAFTVNDEHHVNNYFKNRPGRIYYHLKFTNIHEDHIREYCNDNLKNKNYIESIVDVSYYFDNTFNQDMLQSLVEECNRYDAPPNELIKIMNIFPRETNATYDVVVLNGGTRYMIKSYLQSINFNPNSDYYETCEFKFPPDENSEDNENNSCRMRDDYFLLTPEFLVSHDVRKQEFVFSTTSQYHNIPLTVILTKKPYNEKMNNLFNNF